VVCSQSELSKREGERGKGNYMIYLLLAVVQTPSCQTQRLPIPAQHPQIRPPKLLGKKPQAAVVQIGTVF